MKAYTVNYKMHSADETRMIAVPANNKIDAYERACFEVIPQLESSVPYSVWVAAVTHNNGSYQRFNTFEGKPW